MVDIIIIGAGVSGCAIARELSRKKASIAVVERAEDVCCGTSKANSAIVPLVGPVIGAITAVLLYGIIPW